MGVAHAQPRWLVFLLFLFLLVLKIQKEIANLIKLSSDSNSFHSKVKSDIFMGYLLGLGYVPPPILPTLFDLSVHNVNYRKCNMV